MLQAHDHGGVIVDLASSVEGHGGSNGGVSHGSSMAGIERMARFIFVFSQDSVDAAKIDQMVAAILINDQQTVFEDLFDHSPHHSVEDYRLTNLDFLLHGRIVAKEMELTRKKTIFCAMFV